MNEAVRLSLLALGGATLSATALVVCASILPVEPYKPPTPTQVSEAQPKPATKQVTAAPSINANLVSYQGQLMTDYKVGKVLGEIKCGKRPVKDGIDFLNVNGVPKDLLENHTPELQAGFNSVTVWC